MKQIFVLKVNAFQINAKMSVAFLADAVQKQNVIILKKITIFYFELY